MTLSEAVRMVWRRWWIIAAAVILAVFAIAGARLTRPYQVSLSATVLIPGDTEIPGNSERPELMVMDDVPVLVESARFAEGILAAIPDSGLTARQVRDALSASRYSRVLTVHVTSDEKDRTVVIAGAVADRLSALINQYLVAPGAEPATVQVIDQAEEPTKSRPNEAFKALAVLLAAAGAGALLALAADRIATSRNIR
jgi:capsular polysaccharide biosynthesis protein